VLFVSFVCPHFPLTAPPEFYYQYPLDSIVPPKQYGRAERPVHPFLRDYAQSFVYDKYFDDEKLRKAIAGYYGLCSFLDDNIGQVLRALDCAGLADSTRVLYTSDHGDNLGNRGLWGKSTMYEETAAVPLIMSGADIPAGRVVATPTSHVDVYPFIMQCVGAEIPADDHPGHSLLDIANGFEPERTVLSEYHGMGSTTGAFMIRNGRYKYVHYVRYAPQLFDLADDPEELHDLAGDAARARVLDECRALLGQICDPDDVDRRAKARQRDLLEQNGGRAAVIARGDLGFSPPPGVQPVFE
jgi:choline-sulfatase